MALVGGTFIKAIRALTTDYMYFWKQPVTTGITQFDTVTEIILSYIFLRVRKTDMPAPKEFWHGNQRHLYQLKKNQCIFAVDRFCRETGIPKNRVKKSLTLIENLAIDEKMTISLTITRKTFGLIITVLNGDELFSLDNQFDNHSTITSTSLNNHLPITVTTSNKNGKKDESVETEKERVEPTNPKIEKLKQLIEKHQPTLTGHPLERKIYSAAISAKVDDSDFEDFITFILTKKTISQICKFNFWNYYVDDFLAQKLETETKQKKQDEIGEQRLDMDYYLAD